MYGCSEEEKEVILKAFRSNSDGSELKNSRSDKVAIQRFKGLREMMPEQLWSTTMDPDKRTLQHATAHDAALADEMLSMLTLPRKPSGRWINYSHVIRTDNQSGSESLLGIRGFRLQ